jgi:hypothetical protein
MLLMFRLVGYSESIVTKWPVLAITMLLRDDKSVSKLDYSTADSEKRRTGDLLKDSERGVRVEYWRLGRSGGRVGEISLGSWLTCGGSAIIGVSRVKLSPGAVSEIDGILEGVVQRD